MTSRPTEDLLLAAFSPELAGLDLSPPAGWRVALTGVGALAAAASTARLLVEVRPRRVLFVGTCGAYDDRLSIGARISATEAIATSLDELEGRAYRPEIERTRWPAGWDLPLPGHPVAVPPAITCTAEGARRLGALAAAEHLELTGVFAACAEAGVPAAAALAVANRVGPDANAEWRTHHARVSRELIAALIVGKVL
jgi:purine-nucleoside phosphorylase